MRLYQAESDQIHRFRTQHSWQDQFVNRFTLASLTQSMPGRRNLHHRFGSAAVRGTVAWPTSMMTPHQTRVTHGSCASAAFSRAIRSVLPPTVCHHEYQSRREQDHEHTALRRLPFHLGFDRFVMVGDPRFSFLTSYVQLSPLLTLTIISSIFS